MNNFNYLESYLHDHRIGVLIEIELTSEISSRVPEIRALAIDLAMHIAACNPKDEAELFSQGYVKEPEKTVSELMDEVCQLVGEPIQVARFVRWDIKKNDPANDGPPPRDPANVIRLNTVTR